MNRYISFFIATIGSWRKYICIKYRNMHLLSKVISFFCNQFSYQIQSVQYSSTAHLFCMYTLFKIMIICFVGCLVCAVVLNFCVTRVTSLFFVTNRNETPCNDCGLYFLSGQNTKYRIFKNCLWFALMDF